MLQQYDKFVGEDFLESIVLGVGSKFDIYMIINLNGVF